MSDRTPDGADDRVDGATRGAEEQEARAPHGADRPPNEEDEELLEEVRPDPEVAEHEREMGRLGAEVRGEGRIN